MSIAHGVPTIDGKRIRVDGHPNAIDIGYDRRTGFVEFNTTEFRKIEIQGRPETVEVCVGHQWWGAKVFERDGEIIVSPSALKP